MNVPKLLDPTRHASLYAEALRVAASYGDHVSALPGRVRCDDTNLAAYVDAVLVARPDARCTQEAQVAIWLHRIRTTTERFHRVWQVQAERAASDWRHRPTTLPEALADGTSTTALINVGATPWPNPRGTTR
jgi:hypothetical protein